MKSSKANLPAIAYVCAFLIGVILFWSFGKNWLGIESTLVFIAGVIGVAVSVILFGAWNVIHHSDHKDH